VQFSILLLYWKRKWENEKKKNLPGLERDMRNRKE
jgi:hypothetical protein